MAESAAAIAYAAGRDWGRRAVGTTYVCANTERNHRIVARLRESVGHYHPPALWSYSAHLASLLPPAAAPAVEYTRQTLVVGHNDDDVHIDWWPRAPRRDDTTTAAAIILLFPGLGTQSSCALPRAFAATVAAAAAAGHHHLCGVVNPTSKWHPTRTKEAERVLAFAATEWGAARLMVVGISGSSTILSHVLARAPPQHLPGRGAVLCCFVTDYGAALDRLETGSAEGRAYSRLLAARLRSLMMPANKDCGGKEGCLLSELDAAAARYYGFDSATALRAAMRTEAPLRRIRVPCLLVQPTDDPLQTLSDAAQQRTSARRAVRSNPNLVLVEPTHGAHVGFAESGGGGFYPAQLALALLAERSNSNSKKKRKRRSEEREEEEGGLLV